MISVRKQSDHGLTIDVTGKLEESDYRKLVPVLEEEIERGGDLRLLIRLEEFEGWTPKALVDELRFDVRHHGDVERVAIVGENRWEKLGTRLSAPFFSGEMKFFEDEGEAQAWLS